MSHLEVSWYVIRTVEGHVQQSLPEKGAAANKHPFSLGIRIWATRRQATKICRGAR